MKTITAKFEHIDVEKTLVVPDKEGKERKVRVRKNFGLPHDQEIQIEPGVCPCSVCGHESMDECDAANCQCCSSACT